MKFDIAWHQNCFKRRANGLAENRERLESSMEALERHENEHSFYSAQIELAIKEGKDGFDRERYGYKKLIGI